MIREPARPQSEMLIAELVKLRKKRKIGQQQVADVIGITQGRLSQIESKKSGVSLEAVVLYARAVGAEIAILR